MSHHIQKIVLIEDSDSDAFLIARVIREYPGVGSSYIQRFETMTDARRYLSSTEDDVSVVLLDLNLPDTGGPEDTYRQLREAAPSVPVVALTFSSDHELALGLMRQGIEDFVNKTHILEQPEFLCRAIDFAICRARQVRGAIKRLSEELSYKEQLLSQMVN